MTSQGLEGGSPCRAAPPGSPWGYHSQAQPGCARYSPWQLCGWKAQLQANSCNHDACPPHSAAPPGRPHCCPSHVPPGCGRSAPRPPSRRPAQPAAAGAAPAQAAAASRMRLLTVASLLVAPRQEAPNTCAGMSFMSLISWGFDFHYSSNSWRRQSPREEGASPNTVGWASARGPRHLHDSHHRLSFCVFLAHPHGCPLALTGSSGSC